MSGTNDSLPKSEALAEITPVKPLDQKPETADKLTTAEKKSKAEQTQDGTSELAENFADPRKNADQEDNTKQSAIVRSTSNSAVAQQQENTSIDEIIKTIEQDSHDKNEGNPAAKIAIDEFDGIFDRYESIFAEQTQPPLDQMLASTDHLPVVNSKLDSGIEKLEQVIEALAAQQIAIAKKRNTNQAETAALDSNADIKNAEVKPEQSTVSTVLHGNGLPAEAVAEPEILKEKRDATIRSIENYLAEMSNDKLNKSRAKTIQQILTVLKTNKLEQQIKIIARYIEDNKLNQHHKGLMGFYKKLTNKQTTLVKYLNELLITLNATASTAIKTSPASVPNKQELNTNSAKSKQAETTMSYHNKDKEIEAELAELEKLLGNNSTPLAEPTSENSNGAGEPKRVITDEEMNAKLDASLDAIDQLISKQAPNNSAIVEENPVSNSAHTELDALLQELTESNLVSPSASQDRAEIQLSQNANQAPDKQQITLDIEKLSESIEDESKQLNEPPAAKSAKPVEEKQTSPAFSTKLSLNTVIENFEKFNRHFSALKANGLSNDSGIKDMRAALENSRGIFNAITEFVGIKNIQSSKLFLNQYPDTGSSDSFKAAQALSDAIEKNLKHYIFLLATLHTAYENLLAKKPGFDALQQQEFAEFEKELASFNAILNKPGASNLLKLLEYFDRSAKDQLDKLSEIFRIIKSNAKLASMPPAAPNAAVSQSSSGVFGDADLNALSNIFAATPNSGAAAISVSPSDDTALVTAIKEAESISTQHITALTDSKSQVTELVTPLSLSNLTTEQLFEALLNELKSISEFSAASKQIDASSIINLLDAIGELSKQQLASYPDLANKLTTELKSFTENPAIRIGVRDAVKEHAQYKEIFYQFVEPYRAKIDAEVARIITECDNYTANPITIDFNLEKLQVIIKQIIDKRLISEPANNLLLEELALYLGKIVAAMQTVKNQYSAPANLAPLQRTQFLYDLLEKEQLAKVFIDWQLSAEKFSMLLKDQLVNNLPLQAYLAQVETSELSARKEIIEQTTILPLQYITKFPLFLQSIKSKLPISAQAQHAKLAQQTAAVAYSANQYKKAVQDDIKISNTMQQLSAGMNLKDFIALTQALPSLLTKLSLSDFLDECLLAKVTDIDNLLQKINKTGDKTVVANQILTAEILEKLQQVLPEAFTIKVSLAPDLLKSSNTVISTLPIIELLEINRAYAALKNSKIIINQQKLQGVFGKLMAAFDNINRTALKAEFIEIFNFKTRGNLTELQLKTALYRDIAHEMLKALSSELANVASVAGIKAIASSLKSIEQQLQAHPAAFDEITKQNLSKLQTEFATKENLILNAQVSSVISTAGGETIAASQDAIVAASNIQISNAIDQDDINNSNLQKSTSNNLSEHAAVKAQAICAALQTFNSNFKGRYLEPAFYDNTAKHKVLTDSDMLAGWHAMTACLNNPKYLQDLQHAREFLNNYTDDKTDPAFRRATVVFKRAQLNLTHFHQRISDHLTIYENAISQAMPPAELAKLEQNLIKFLAVLPNLTLYQQFLNCCAVPSEDVVVRVPAIQAKINTNQVSGNSIASTESVITTPTSSHAVPSSHVELKGISSKLRDLSIWQQHCEELGWSHEIKNQHILHVLPKSDQRFGFSINVQENSFNYTRPSSVAVISAAAIVAQEEKSVLASMALAFLKSGAKTARLEGDSTLCEQTRAALHELDPTIKVIIGESIANAPVVSNDLEARTTQHNPSVS